MIVLLVDADNRSIAPETFGVGLYSPLVIDFDADTAVDRAVELTASGSTAGYVAADPDAARRRRESPLDRSRHRTAAMTDLASKIRRDGSSMAFAVVGVLVVVAVGFGIIVGSIRLLLPAAYPVLPGTDPTMLAAAVGFGPALVYGVVVAVAIRRYVVKRG
ncbi:hypothetical protein [Haloplanus natans]|uniref:hypothetical protein n=1 Tax=Haloplanus natans TaxID=376171 RepID=UPI0012FA31E8|nr:hypothetical protein [Haloplanus natans]